MSVSKFSLSSISYALYPTADGNPLIAPPPQLQKRLSNPFRASSNADPLTDSQQYYRFIELRVDVCQHICSKEQFGSIHPQITIDSLADVTSLIVFFAKEVCQAISMQITQAVLSAIGLFIYYKTLKASVPNSSNNGERNVKKIYHISEKDSTFR